MRLEGPTSLENLDPDLRELEIFGCDDLDLSRFTRLEVLRLIGCRIQEVPALPSLRDLEIHYSFIERLAQVPRHFKSFGTLLPEIPRGPLIEISTDEELEECRRLRPLGLCWARMPRFNWLLVEPGRHPRSNQAGRESLDWLWKQPDPAAVTGVFFSPPDFNRWRIEHSAHDLQPQWESGDLADVRSWTDGPILRFAERHPGEVFYREREVLIQRWLKVHRVRLPDWFTDMRRLRLAGVRPHEYTVPIRVQFQHESTFAAGEYKWGDIGYYNDDWIRPLVQERLGLFPIADALDGQGNSYLAIRLDGDRGVYEFNPNHPTVFRVFDTYEDFVEAITVL